MYNYNDCAIKIKIKIKRFKLSHHFAANNKLLVLFKYYLILFDYCTNKKETVIHNFCQLIHLIIDDNTNQTVINCL